MTEDKDFGWLVYASMIESPGVIFIRYPGNARQQMADAVLKLVREYGAELVGAFVVMQPGQVRINPRRMTE